MSDDNLPRRSLRTTIALTGFFTLYFMSRNQSNISFGLLIGGSLGIFSLWTLTVAIPKLFHSGSIAGRFLLGLLTMAKLPIYMIVLNFAMTSSKVSAFSVFVGVVFTPAVIVMKTLGQMLIDSTAQLNAGETTCRTNSVPSN